MATKDKGGSKSRKKAPELADPLGAFEVAEREDVEQLGAGSGTECVQAFA
jgi:hypothetical protein